MARERVDIKVGETMVNMSSVYATELMNILVEGMVAYGACPRQQEPEVALATMEQLFEKLSNNSALDRKIQAGIARKMGRQHLAKKLVEA